MFITYSIQSFVCYVFYAAGGKLFKIHYFYWWRLVQIYHQVDGTLLSSSKYGIDQARSHSFLFTSGLKKKMAFTATAIAEFVTKTERKKCKNTQNISRDECYPL